MVEKVEDALGKVGPRVFTYTGKVREGERKK